MTDTTSFHDLVPVKPREIGGATVQTVDARLLHGALQVGRDFSTWIKGKIERYGFVDGQDFVATESLSSPNPGSAKARPQMMVEYTLTLDMAKELAMVENNERGRAVRRYFLACERMVKEMLGSNGITPQVVGGVVKGIVNRAIEETIRHKLPEIVAAAIATDPRRAVAEFISARELLDQARAVSKKRRSLNARLGWAMRARACEQGVALRRCPHSGKWLYPVEFAETCMAQFGRDWVNAHNLKVAGQGVLKLVPRRAPAEGDRAS